MSSSKEEKEIVDEQSTSSQEEVDKPYQFFQQACNEFFRPERLGNYEFKPTDKPEDVVFNDGEIGEVYDITGFSAFEVIAGMSALINDGSRWTKRSTGKVFYFIIKRQDEKDGEDKIFKIYPSPEKDQPGNGWVLVGTHIEINKELAATTHPETFAAVIMKLFKDNSGIEKEKTVIAQEYFLLLFEIARRLSNKKGKKATAKGLDGLPIASVIARKLKLLATVTKNGDAVPSWEPELKSFSKCFKYEFEKREASIKEIFKIDDAGRPTSPKSCKEELEEIFGGSDAEILKLRKLPVQDEEELTKKLEKRNWKLHKVHGDGACFFRAVSHQVHGTEHSDIRKAGIEYIRDHRDIFGDFLGEAFDDYIGRMSQEEERCDDIIMRAVAYELDIVIRIIRPNQDDYVLYPPGRDGPAPREVVVVYSSHGTHYDSVLPRE